jgi:hypothetical protein
VLLGTGWAVVGGGVPATAAGTVRHFAVGVGLDHRLEAEHRASSHRWRHIMADMEGAPELVFA